MWSFPSPSTRRFPGKRLELTAHFQIRRWTVTLTVAQRAGSPRPFPWCWKASPGPRWCHISRSDRWGRPHSHLGRDLTPQETAEHRALLTTSARSPRSLENATARRPHGTRGRRQAESWSLTALCAHGTGVGWASSSKLCWSVGCARGGHTGSKDGRPRGHAWWPPHRPNKRLAFLGLGLCIRGRDAVRAGASQGGGRQVRSELPGTLRVLRAAHWAPTPGGPAKHGLRPACPRPAQPCELLPAASRWEPVPLMAGIPRLLPP